jgi:hypothetical protein
VARLDLWGQEEKRCRLGLMSISLVPVVTYRYVNIIYYVYIIYYTYIYVYIYVYRYRYIDMYVYLYIAYKYIYMCYIQSERCHCPTILTSHTVIVALQPPHFPIASTTGNDSPLVRLLTVRHAT